jgi:hypothetical protein
MKRITWIAAVAAELFLIGCANKADTGKPASRPKLTTQTENCFGTDTDGTPRVSAGEPVESLRLLPNFYQTPHMPFVLGPGEQVIPVRLGTVSGKEAQKILDDERACVTQGVFVVTVEGVISIASAPLAPKARTCFIFRKGAGIIAAPGCTSRELVLIKDTEYVSFQSAAGLIDGGNMAVAGIRVENSGKVHLDGMAITRCGGDGVSISGRGSDRYADGVSLTRSAVSGCGGNGVAVRQSAQFIALDNRVTGNRGAGFDVESPSAILANNICAANATGISFSSRDGTLTRNQLIANGTGIVLAAESEYALVYENAIQDNLIGADVRGKTATLCWNTFANRKQLAASGKDNLVQANKGVTAEDAAAPGACYFNPPTVSNPHRERVIWKGSGKNDSPMERCDITVDSGATPMDVRILADSLLKARSENPGNVLVATLKGTFVVRSREGLLIPDHTCILLYGTITNESCIEQRDQLVAMTGKGCVSFSGGKLFSASTVYAGFSGAGANNTLLLDGTQINLSAPHGRAGSQSVNAVNAKKHGGAFVLRGCEIRDPGSRGIWAHVSSRIFTLGNRFYAGGMTIDFDAYCNHSAALYNTISDATYHSAIFFEEGVKFNAAFGNRCFSNNNAIAVWCEAVTGVTENNIIACNVLSENGVLGGFDLGIGGRAATKRADRNYAFNNQISRNRGRGGINLKSHGAGNYIAQSVLIDCPTNIANYSTKPFSLGYDNNSGFAAPAR